MAGGGAQTETLLKMTIFFSKRGLGAQGGFVKLAAQGRRITL